TPYISGLNFELGLESTSNPFLTKYSTAVPIPMLSSFAALSKFILLPSVIYYFLNIISYYKHMFFYKHLTIYYKLLNPQVRTLDYSNSGCKIGTISRMVSSSNSVRLTSSSSDSANTDLAVSKPTRLNSSIIHPSISSATSSMSTSSSSSPLSRYTSIS